MRLRLELDQETSEALYQAAERELRLPSQQAEAILRQALGLPSPSGIENPRAIATNLSLRRCPMNSSMLRFTQLVAQVRADRAQRELSSRKVDPVLSNTGPGALPKTFSRSL